MAHFLKPSASSSAGYDLDNKGALWRLRVPLGKSSDVTLWGGGDGGEKLRVTLNDPSVATVSEAGAPGPDLRLFRLSPKKAGNAMIEAKNSKGAVWAFIQIVVEEAIRRKGGPQLGQDGPIPSKYAADVRAAIEIAWGLDKNPKFVEVFRNTVAKLSNRNLTSEIYSTALNKMVINHAETSKDRRIIQELKSDAEARKKDPLYQSAPAFSFKDATNIWIRDFSLAKGQRAIAANIIHEAVHLVGAPGDLIAEFAIDAIHNEAGLRR